MPTDPREILARTLIGRDDLTAEERADLQLAALAAEGMVIARWSDELSPSGWMRSVLVPVAEHSPEETGRG